MKTLVEEVARSDAEFDGRPFDGLSRVDRERYMARAQKALSTVAFPAIRDACAEVALERDEDGIAIWPDGHEIVEAIRALSLDALPASPASAESCADCNSARIAHCAHPEHCGGMKPAIPASGAAAEGDFVRVPSEPTREMLEAGWLHVTVGLADGRPGTLHALWRAMIAAAPQQVAEEDLRDFARWVDTWVSNPVGAFSVNALDGLFAQARDRLARLPLAPPQQQEQGGENG